VARPAASTPTKDVAAPPPAIATWSSLALMPPGTGPGPIRPLRALRLALRFVWASTVAGVDIARRAFSPRMPLAPGYVTHRLAVPPGAASLFASITSLLPGTLPAGTDAAGDLVYHCLDVGQPVAAELAVEEAAFMEVLA
jgi:multicomponent Na+:H+ antiporter subunit E